MKEGSYAYFNKESLVKKITWIVIANSAKALIYQVENHRHHFLKTLEHPESRLKISELVSDHPGHYQTGHGTRGQYESANTPHQLEQAHFAKELAHFLLQQHQAHQYDHLILCAAPHFHGLLNHEMDPAVEALILETVSKDYVPLASAELNELIEAMVHRFVPKSGCCG